MREVKNIKNVAYALNSLGEIKRMQGNAKDSIAYYKEALAIARELNNKNLKSLF